MSRKFLGLRTFCIVTGASKGIGSKIAVELAKKFGKGSLMLLMARSLEGLSNTKKLISEANEDIVILTYSTDLSKPKAEEFSVFITEAFRDCGVDSSSFALGMIVHNAGSVGDLQEYCSDMTDVEKMQQYFSLNLYSVMCLTSVFLQFFNKDNVASRLVINITSLCGIEPFKSLGYYCMGKASREMYFRVLAKENPTLNVLSYSPGPVNTDMISHIIEDVKDPEVKDMFLGMKDANSILTTDQTVLRFINILNEGKFKSGDRVDYFDK